MDITTMSKEELETHFPPLLGGIKMSIPDGQLDGQLELGLKPDSRNRWESYIADTAKHLAELTRKIWDEVKIPEPTDEARARAFELFGVQREDFVQPPREDFVLTEREDFVQPGKFCVEEKE
jgi:hypothetical protein